MLMMMTLIPLGVLLAVVIAAIIFIVKKNKRNRRTEDLNSFPLTNAKKSDESDENNDSTLSESISTNSESDNN
jgi:hypothetical protein